MTPTRDAIHNPPIPAQRTDTKRRPADDPVGSAAAALTSAAFSVCVLGLCVLLSDASPTVKGWMTWSAAVGPLSGKSTIACAAYLVAWPLLHLRLRHRRVNPGRVLTMSFVLVGNGLLLTFPPFYTLLSHTLP